MSIYDTFSSRPPRSKTKNDLLKKMIRNYFSEEKLYVYNI